MSDKVLRSERKNIFWKVNRCQSLYIKWLCHTYLTRFNANETCLFSKSFLPVFTRTNIMSIVSTRIYQQKYLMLKFSFLPYICYFYTLRSTLFCWQFYHEVLFRSGVCDMTIFLSILGTFFYIQNFCLVFVFDTIFV